MRWLTVFAVFTSFQSVGWCAEPLAEQVQALIQKLNDSDEEVRGSAVNQLREIGPEARAAIPALIERLHDKGQLTVKSDFPPGLGSIGIDHVAGKALKDIGIDSVPPLGELLKGRDQKLRIAALEILAEIGEPARTELDAIALLIADPNEEVQRAALSALVRLDPVGDSALPILNRLLDTKDEYLRHGAAQSLSKYPGHPQTWGTLTKALKSTHPEVRGEAVMALNQLSGPREKIIALLWPRLHDEGTYSVLISNHAWGLRSIRDDALDGLLKHGGDSNRLWMQLRVEFDRERWKESQFDRVTVLNSIPQLKPLPKGVGERVFKFYRDEVDRRLNSKGTDEEDLPGYEVDSLVCLAKIPEQSRSLTPQFHELLSSQDGLVRAEAAVMLAAFDPVANPKAVDEVSHLLSLMAGPEDPNDKQTAKVLQEALQQRIPDTRPEFLSTLLLPVICTNDRLVESLLPRLVRWYQHPDADGHLRDTLEAAFRRLGPKAKLAGPALISSYSRYQDTVAVALVELGPEMVPLLIDAIKQVPDTDYGPWNRLGYLEVLVRFRDRAAPALPLLFELLTIPDQRLQVQVINQLGKLTDLPDAVVPELIKLLRHDRCRIRAAAATNLGHFKNRADTIIPQLVLAQKDDYAEVRAAALESLLKFGIDQPAVRRAIESAQHDQHPYLKLLAAEALQK